MALKNRLVEYPNRYKLVDENGTETGPYTLVRDEGAVEEEGTPLTAENIAAAIQEAVAAAMEGIKIDSNGNMSVRNIQRGRASVTGKAASVVTKEITFSKAFTKVPTVVVTPSTGSPQNVHASVYNVTTKGFTLYLYRKTKGTNVINWIAMI